MLTGCCCLDHLPCSVMAKMRLLLSAKTAACVVMQVKLTMNRIKQVLR